MHHHLFIRSLTGGYLGCVICVFTHSPGDAEAHSHSETTVLHCRSGCDTITMHAFAVLMPECL